jgi:hypothetical protein
MVDMAAKISLKDLEKDVFQKTFQDGIVDIQIGSVLLIFVIAPFLSPFLGDFWSSVIFLPFWGAIFVGLRVLRKRVIKPRVGVVEYGEYRKSRLKKISLVILAINILALLLGLGSFFYFSLFPGWIYPLQLSIILLVGFSLAGYMLEFPRLYLYGIMTALAPVIGEILYAKLGVSHHGFPVTFGFSASVMIFTGLVILLRLLRKFPSLSGEEQE